jgi:pyruvate kinase
VLENLAKSGIPTRAEISDVVEGVQAECIMLNKGPYINEAIKTLNDILIRMESHVSKKKSSLRPLQIAENAYKELMEKVKTTP